MGQKTAKNAASKQAKVIDLKTIKRNKIWCRILALSAMVIGQVAYSFVQESYVYAGSSGQKLINAILLSVILVVVMELCYHGQLRMSNTWEMGQKKLGNIDLLVSLGGLVLILLVQLAGAALLGSQTSHNQAAIDKLMKNSSQQIYIMLCLLAPICEELIYRGFFFQVLQLKKGKTEKIIGVILSGLLFAFAHDPGFDVFYVYYFLMGSVLAGLYAATDNLTVSMTAHALNNILAVYLSGM